MSDADSHKTSTKSTPENKTADKQPQQIMNAPSTEKSPDEPVPTL